MTPMMQARFGIARWRLRIAWIEIKAAMRALFGPHPWKESNSAGDKIVGNRIMRGGPL